jgi:alpha-tubulin suppressor-like RCC1 family protein
MPKVGVTFRQISTNGKFSCAIGSNDAAYCWGYGGNGMLGNGANTSKNTPVPVTMPEGVTFKQISTNSYFSCAIGSNDAAYCWGNGSYGKLGNGKSENSNIPVRVANP